MPKKNRDHKAEYKRRKNLQTLRKARRSLGQKRRKS